MDIKKYAPTFIVITTVASFISDVLQPLGPVLFYSLIIAFVGAVTLTIIRKKINDKIRIARGFLWIWTGISGVFFVTQLLLGAGNTGVAADLVPGIASLQDRFGIVQAQIEEVRLNTEEIKESTARIESSLEEIGQLGGIVANPETPEHWYSNAKIYELKGDFGNARRAYLQCLPKMPNKIDAHLDFIQFLKAQEGRMGAREIYLPISKKNSGVATKVALARLLQSDKQGESLEKITIDGDIPSPVLYLLADRYSEDSLGTQTLSDKRLELKWLREFVESIENKPYLRYFADQANAADWSDIAVLRLATLEATTSSTTLENPVQFGSVWWSWTDGGSSEIWINLTLAEPAIEIEYRVERDGSFKSSGLSEFIDNRTGQRQPNTQLPFPCSLNDLNDSNGEFFIEIRYTTPKRDIAGPFDLTFNVVNAIKKNTKNTLLQVKTTWLEPPSNTIYTHDTSWYVGNLRYLRIAIKSARYKFADSPSEEWSDFPIEETSDLRTMPGGSIQRYDHMNNFDNNYFDFGGSDKIFFQIEWYDGTWSDVYKYRVAALVPARREVIELQNGLKFELEIGQHVQVDYERAKRGVVQAHTGQVSGEFSSRTGNYDIKVGGERILIREILLIKKIDNPNAPAP